MTAVGHDTLKPPVRSSTSNGRQIAYYSLAKAAETLGDISRLPFSMKVLLENLLRFEDGGFTVTVDDLQAMVQWLADQARPSARSSIARRAC
jgi:aconitate hydratase